MKYSRPELLEISPSCLTDGKQGSLCTNGNKDTTQNCKNGNYNTAGICNSGNRNTAFGCNNGNSFQ
ncbi:MAG: hypothetical protein ACUVWN_13435 [bacterium]